MPDHSRNIHERFLRHIWSRQYLDQSRLRTSNGKNLKVLEAGKLNLAGGPDFSDAKVKIDTTTFVGDVEIHRNAADWFTHQHHDDPRYNRVILHVVLDADPQHFETISSSGRRIPVLILSDFLSESIQSIWQKAILDERARRCETIKCADRNATIDSPTLIAWLRKLAYERLELKLRRFEERLKELAREDLMAIYEHLRTYGEPPLEGNPNDIPPPFRELTQKDLSKKALWEQVLYEGLMEGLGYSKNQEPFLRLARNVTLGLLRSLHLFDDDNRRAAVLFAVAGVLPKIKSLKTRESKEYARNLIRSWNDLRSSVRVGKLHAEDWQFFPTRPNNFPTLRIAAANLLIRKLLHEELFRTVIQTVKSEADADRVRRSLIGLLSVEADEYWKHHYDFDQPTKREMVVLGISRINELIVNTIVPVALLYARIFKDLHVREHVLKLYESFPPSEENSLTRLMQKNLVGGRMQLDTVGKQQGAIQLYKFYCTEGRCSECEIGQTLFAA